MNKLDDLYNILSQQLDLYDKFLVVETEKYNVILIDDIKRLDEIVSEEQAFFLKSRGLDKKRENLLKELNLTEKTLKEIVECVEESEKDRFSDIHKKIYKVLFDFKEKNIQCQELVQMRLNRAQAMIKMINDSNNQSEQYFKDGNLDKIDINRNNIISKKI